MYMYILLIQWGLCCSTCSFLYFVDHRLSCCLFFSWLVQCLFFFSWLLQCLFFFSWLLQCLFFFSWLLQCLFFFDLRFLTNTFFYLYLAFQCRKGIIRTQLNIYVFIKVIICYTIITRPDINSNTQWHSTNVI